MHAYSVKKFLGAILWEVIGDEIVEIEFEPLACWVQRDQKAREEKSNSSWGQVMNRAAEADAEDDPVLAALNLKRVDRLLA